MEDLETEDLEQTDELEALHEEFIKNFENAQNVESDVRKQCVEDRRFYSISGAQWEDELKSFFENRPRIEINKVALSVMRIISEYRNNRITVDFVSKDGTNNESLADLCDGLYRSDEQDSNADEAYDNAFEEGVGGGMGAWRLRADYEDEEDEEDERQRICIEPIYDADSCVFFDTNAKRQDKRDAKWAGILTSITKDEFLEEYGYIPQSVNKQTDTSFFDWNTKDGIYLVEYFKLEEVSKTIKTYVDIEGNEEKYSDKDFENNENLEQDLTAKGYKFKNQRKVKAKKVHKYIMSGDKLLEDCGYIAGSEIPIVPFYGKRWYIDNKEQFMGHVRLSKDAQRLHNLQVSRLAETAALSPLEKPIMLPEQIQGLRTYWENDNQKNYPYMLINSIKNTDGSETIAGPVGYTKPPQIAPALAGLLQFTDSAMKELQGSEQAMEVVSSNLSGEAIQKIHDRLDMQTYIYMSNFAKAIKRSGEIWLSMAKDVYVEDGRKMKVVNQDKTASFAELNQPYKEDGQTVIRNDLSKAKFNIAVSVGASTSSKKQKTVNNLIQALGVITVPELQSVISHLVLMNMEGEGVNDASIFARKQLLKQGVIKPNEKEAIELQQLAMESQNQAPTAEQQYFEAEANKSNAQAVKAKADTFKVLAETEKTKMEVADILSKIDERERQQVLDAIDKLYATTEMSNVPMQPIVNT